MCDSPTYYCRCGQIFSQPVQDAIQHNLSASLEISDKQLFNLTIHHFFCRSFDCFTKDVKNDADSKRFTQTTANGTRKL